MSVTVNAKEFKQAVQNVSRVVCSKAKLPVLKHLLVSAENDKVFLTATDLDCFVRQCISAQVEESINVAISAKELSRAIKNLSQKGSVSLTTDNNQRTVTIMQDALTLSLPYMSTDEFPQMPYNAGDTLGIVDSETLLKGLQYTIDCAAKRDDNWEIIKSIYIKSIENYLETSVLRFVSTDKYRLAVCNIPHVPHCNIDMVIPRKYAELLLKVVPATQHITFTKAVDTTERQLDFVLLSTDTMEVAIGVWNSTHYPNYERVIPVDYAYNMVVSRLDFLNALKQLAAGVKKSEPCRIQMVAENNQVCLQTKTAQESVAAQVSRPFQLMFNAIYLIEILDVLECDTIEMQFQNDGMKLFIVKNPQDSYVFYVVMPMRPE